MCHTVPSSRSVIVISPDWLIFDDVELTSHEASSHAAAAVVVDRISSDEVACRGYVRLPGEERTRLRVA
jgi:hypothetical protein